jgi:hypothetical protein
MSVYSSSAKAAVGIALLSAFALSATSAEAQHRRGPGPVAGIAAGVAVGALVGAAIAGEPVYAYPPPPPPVYYGPPAYAYGPPPPRCYTTSERFWVPGYGYRFRPVTVCD